MSDTQREVLEYLFKQVDELNKPPKFDPYEWIKKYFVALRYS